MPVRAYASRTGGGVSSCISSTTPSRACPLCQRTTFGPRSGAFRMRSKNESSGTRPTLGAGGDSPRRCRANALLAVLRRRGLLDDLAQRGDELVGEDEHPAAARAALGAQARVVAAVGRALADDQ